MWGTGITPIPRQDQGLRRCLRENPGVEVVIDLHRDGVAESTRLVTQVNGIQMAQVMFLTGWSRTTAMGILITSTILILRIIWQSSFQMQLKAAEYYPGFHPKNLSERVPLQYALLSENTAD